MPALVREIRASTVVPGFFGSWRGDYDQLARSRPLAEDRSQHFEEDPDFFGPFPLLHLFLRGFS
jgi:hypothetical protein